jgi:hypothetical protein
MMPAMKQLIALCAALPLALSACSDSTPGGAGWPIGGPETDVGVGFQDAAIPDGAAADPGAGVDGAGTPDPGPASDPGAGPGDTGATTPDPGAAAGDLGGSSGGGVPKIAVDPEHYTFSYIAPVTTTLVKQVNIYNIGNGPLTVKSIQWASGSSPDFTMSLVPPPNKVLAPGKSVFVNVIFDDLIGGTATLNIESTDPDAPLVTVEFDSYLKATSAQPEPCGTIEPSALNFGSVQRGQSKTLQAVLKNCGSQDALTLSSITRSKLFFLELSQEFQIDNAPALPHQLPPAGGILLDVTYTPKLAGPDSGYFAFHVNDPNEPQIQLNVSGVGTSPPPEDIGLTVKLSWDANHCDVDSHLIAPGGSFGDCKLDCFFANPAPDWGTQGDWLDDPFLDTDDVDGFGPEHINISEPQAGIYKYVVHYYDDSFEGGMSTDTNATVEVYSYGVLIGTYGPVNLDTTNRNWDVFTIDWPSATLSAQGNTYMSNGVGACGLFNFP